MIFVFDDLELNTHPLELRRGGVPVRADAIVLRVLSVLVENSGELVTKERLHDLVWGGRAVSENVITVAMTRLRKTLGVASTDSPPYVITVHGRGYRFARPVTAKSGRSASPPGPGTPPFVGREAAVARFRSVLGDARSGRGSLLVLLGEAGIGKTRLVEEIEPEAKAQGFAIAWGVCREAGDTPPLWPFVQVLRGLLESAQPDLRAPRLSQALGEVSRLVPELAAFGGADAALSREEPLATYRLFDAVARLLTIVSETRPCLVILEDLHRADSASLEVVRYFIDQIPRTRVALVATHRTGAPVGAAVRGHLGYVLGHRNAARFTLEPLAEDQVSECVAFALDDPSGAAGRAVFEKCEGNPFLMTELLRVLLDAGGGSGATAVELGFPGAALEHMRQRVATVDERSRGALSAAAVLGRRFDFATLEAVAELPPQDLMAGLDLAMESGVIRAAPQAKTSFAFAHDLMRAVLYDGLPLAERRELHLRVVAALSQRRAAGAAVPEAELAYHAYAALPAGDARATVAFCVEAAAAAARRRAYADGVRVLGQALEALELVSNPSPRFRLSLLLSRTLQARVCHTPEFGAIANEAARLARELDAPGKLGRVGLLLDVHPGLPALPGARRMLEESLDRLPDDDGETRACLLGRLANSAPTAFDGVRARAYLAEATVLAVRSGTVLARHTVLTARLYAEGGPAHDAELVHVIRDLEEICEANPDAMSVIPVLIELHRAVRAAQRGARVEADAALARSVSRCRSLGHVELLWHTERFRLLLRRGDMDADVFGAALVALHRRAEREVIPSSALFVAYDVAVVLQLPPGAREGVVGLLPARVPEEPPGLWAVRVRTLAAGGRRDEALALLRLVSPSALSALPGDRDHVGTLGTLFRAAVELGAREYEAALAALLAPYDGYAAVNAAFHSEGPVRSLLRGVPRFTPRAPAPVDDHGERIAPAE